MPKAQEESGKRVKTLWQPLSQTSFGFRWFTACLISNIILMHLFGSETVLGFTMFTAPNQHLGHLSSN